MILSNLLQACLMAVCAGVILGLALIILALITYFVAAFVSILIQTFKDVRAKQRYNKYLKTLGCLAKYANSMKTDDKSR